MPQWLGRLPWPWKAVLGMTGVAVALVWLVRIAYLPVLSRISAHRAALMDLTVKLADAQVLAGQLAGQEEVLQLTQQRYDALQRQIGGTLTVPRVLERLGTHVEAHHLALMAVHSHEDEVPHLLPLGPALTLRTVPITLQVSGRYQAIGEWLGAIGRAPLCTSVQSLELTKPQAAQDALRADLVIAVYQQEGG